MKTFAWLVLAVSAVLSCSCQPLKGTDPLDSGELSAAVLQPVSSAPDRQDERDLLNDRVRRLGGEDKYESRVRMSAGITVASDF